MTGLLIHSYAIEKDRILLHSAWTCCMIAGMRSKDAVRISGGVFYFPAINARRDSPRHKGFSNPHTQTHGKTPETIRSFRVFSSSSGRRFFFIVPYSRFLRYTLIDIQTDATLRSKVAAATAPDNPAIERSTCERAFLICSPAIIPRKTVAAIRTK